MRHIPAPAGDPDGFCNCSSPISITATILGRLAVGRVFNGSLRHGDEVGIEKLDGSVQRTRITKLCTFVGLKRIDETIARPGDQSRSSVMRTP